MMVVFRRHPQNRVEVGWRTNPCTQGPHPPLPQDLAIALQFHHPQERAQHSHPPHCHHHCPLFHYLSPSCSFLATATRGPLTSSLFLIHATYHPIRNESLTILFGLQCHDLTYRRLGYLFFLSYFFLCLVSASHYQRTSVSTLDFLYTPLCPGIPKRHPSSPLCSYPIRYPIGSRLVSIACLAIFSY